MLRAAEVESGWRFKESASAAVAEWFGTSELLFRRRLWEARLRYSPVCLSDWPYVDGCER